jgi:uncharacterized membrane protein
MSTTLLVLSVLAALGCGLIGGVFFAFSTFVMRALARLPASSGIAAMQTINVVVINPIFLGAFLGTTLISIAMVPFALSEWQAGRTIYLLAGSGLYVVGTFGVTMVCNVPRNNRLAAIAANDPASAPQWSAYVRSWTAWNHVRTAAALLAAACFSIALAH